jgi:hypothetical protein
VPQLANTINPRAWLAHYFRVPTSHTAVRLWQDSGRGGEGGESPRVLRTGWFAAGTNRSLLKPDLNTGLKAEVALTVVAMCEVVAEAGQLIVRIEQPDGDLLAHHDVKAGPRP